MNDDICSNNHRGNPESEDAFRNLAPHLNKQTARVVCAICARPEGITAEEIEDLLELSRSSVSARCSELRKRRLILPKSLRQNGAGKPHYLRRKNRSGASAAVLVWNEAYDYAPFLKLLEEELGPE